MVFIYKWASSRYSVHVLILAGLMHQENFQRSQFEKHCTNPITFQLQPSFSPPLRNQAFWKNYPHILSPLLSLKHSGFDPCHSTETDHPSSNFSGEISGQGSVPTATLQLFDSFDLSLLFSGLDDPIDSAPPKTPQTLHRHLHYAWTSLLSMTDGNWW